MKTKKYYLKLAIGYNKIFGEYTDKEIIDMSKNQLRTITYDFKSYCDDLDYIRSLVLDDIKNNLYMLEGKNIEFTWFEYVVLGKPIKHKETYNVHDFRLWEVKKYPNKLSMTLDKSWKCWNYSSFSQDKLKGFYKSFMKQIKYKNIYEKISEVQTNEK